MSLSLQNVSLIADSEYYIDNANLTLESGSFNVLLGRTLAGKTSLMRLMAGLDKPTEGRVMMNGVDVTGVSVQKRNISMVYQQFINYPSWTVFENIASPLRLEKLAESEIIRRVHETAEMLHIEDFLQRRPLELSGGQQQRTAMARALVKDASLILFDEPLVNLDYKLREELRQEIRELLKARNSLAVYATTEPSEALALGGTTTLLHEGRIIQSGVSSEVFRFPVNIDAAGLFSEPPINLIPGFVSESEMTFDEFVHFPLNQDLRGFKPGAYVCGVRPSHIGLVPHADDDLEISVRVEVAEISGSETFLHVKNDHCSLVLQLSGVHEYRIDTPIKVYLPTHKLFMFGLNGTTLQAPGRLHKGA
ncbi:ABC transporter ATP-binding protein [Neptunomonas antarctica]|uniref:Carbohydrate ABC transporter ATP-binding protein, CUT1 family n=1 Tax=Neptunomonas antarctica TaxID=619304 RepID=A0A1N7KZ72_9GAMM|nr:ABC transporter ATP-binding protein [Neptunomonas antarctica]SIS66878.1 carbohydrate ABC transporter ATP-binding protein, CUT1 family [Neptunomonas antarctica]